MPGPSSISIPVSDLDPLARVLAEMVDSALKWESEHPNEDPVHQNRLTEDPRVIHLIYTDLLATDAVPESPMEGDANVPA